MTRMTKEAYEANPRAYWDSPRPEMKEIKRGALGAPLLSDSPIWVNGILPEVGAITLANGCRDLCLDLGCGGGRYIFHAAGHFKRVVGIDFSALNIAAAERTRASVNAENVELRHADLGHIKFVQDASVDFAYSAAVFMHMPTDSKRRALAELCRVLKPDGVAVLVEIVPITFGAFDCPDIEEYEWDDMISEAGLAIESIDQYEAFSKFKVRRRQHA